MNDRPPVDAVRAQMQQIRCDIDRDLDEMVASARRMVDWRHYVKTYPWTCLGAAAALGFLIVPKRKMEHGPESAAEPAPAATRGWVDAIWATATSIAVRKAIELLGQSAARVLGTAADSPHRPSPVVDGVSDCACRQG